MAKINFTQDDLLTGDINFLLLVQQLKEAGLSGNMEYARQNELLTGWVEAEPEQWTLVQQVLSLHDPAQLSDVELRKLRADIIYLEADEAARQVPTFITMTVEDAQAWVDANVTDTASLIAAMRKVAKNLAALNSKVFPQVRAELEE